MTPEQKQLLNIDNYSLFLQNNYSLFLPQMILQNTRYRVYDVIADFEENNEFSLRYKVEDLKTNISTRAGVRLNYDLVQNCYDRWHEPMF